MPLSGGGRPSRPTAATSSWPGGPTSSPGPTDFAYLPPGTTARSSAAGGRFALCAARTDRRLPVRYGAAAEVPVELRGAGPVEPAGAQLRHPDALDAGAIIACEVITPGGNWSSYPAHKHDEASEHRERARGDLLLRDRRRPARRARPRLHPHLVLAGARDRDRPRRCTTATPCSCRSAGTAPPSPRPGHDMYYLNVMAGPPHPAPSAAGLADQRPPRPDLGARHLGRPGGRPATDRSEGS